MHTYCSSRVLSLIPVKVKLIFVIMCTSNTLSAKSLEAFLAILHQNCMKVVEIKHAKSHPSAQMEIRAS